MIELADVQEEIRPSVPNILQAPYKYEKSFKLRGGEQDSVFLFLISLIFRK